MAKTDENITIEERSFLGINLSSDIKRANYLARVFAIFYETLLEIWLKNQGFESMGRPSIYDKNENPLRKTYDYTLKKNGEYFIVEAKCYLAYSEFKHLELTSGSLELLLGGEDNFNFFCNLGQKEPYEKYKFYYPHSSDDYFTPDGKILIWSKVKKSEIEKIKNNYKFSDIFSIEDAINDMIKEAKSGSLIGKEYHNLISKYKEWSDELFGKLIG